MERKSNHEKLAFWQFFAYAFPELASQNESLEDHDMEQIYFGQRIAALRKERGMTQEALGQRLGVTNQAVSKWESDQCCPDIMQLPALADVFEISMDALFGRAEPAAQIPEPQTAIRDLPWEDNDDLHAVCYVGHRLVSYEEIPQSGGLKFHFRFGGKEMFSGDGVVLTYTGAVRDIYSDFPVTCQNVQGNVQGNVQVEGDLSCAEIYGAVNCAGDIDCRGTISGDVQAEGDISCAAIQGNVSAGGDVACHGSIGGNAMSEGDIECADIGGNAIAEGDIRCAAIYGSAKAQGDITVNG